MIKFILKFIKKELGIVSPSNHAFKTAIGKELKSESLKWYEIGKCARDGFGHGLGKGENND